MAIERVARRFGLGRPAAEPVRVSGGLSNELWRVATDTGSAGPGGARVAAQGGWLDYNAAHRPGSPLGKAEVTATLARLRTLAAGLDALLAALARLPT
ncbi:hypothetical protein DMB66_48095 [Actinoplanes sp. ATCC 53533]|uniref:hypothetical protein n=1 Tax=Actinoplanes sp. ATCC 53533 TaxID=1288362 RepID=UPI000F7AF51D|nr:hypothetical protein [Actinoplanes sp. ATCC 53533]RSM47515.1 hypothetical protein DMB66_48095 [Actinoplanes sp. ATCC 53533]